MSLRPGTSGRTALTVAQTIGTAVAAYYTGGWGGPVAQLFHTAFWSLYDSTAPDTRQEQESIANLTIQQSTLGIAIPQVFGIYGGIAGNVIFATPKVEHTHAQAQEQGGKGGGPKNVVVTKTYTISMAIGLADTRITGPLKGIAAIYRDLSLFWSKSSGQPFPDNWTFYSGTADQEYDPYMQAYFGAEVPAYHYLAYVVIQNDDLGPSARTYNYTFDLIHSDTAASTLGAIFRSPADGTLWVNGGGQAWHINDQTLETLGMAEIPHGDLSERALGWPPSIVNDAGLFWTISEQEVSPGTGTFFWRAVPVNPDHTLGTYINYGESVPYPVPCSNMIAVAQYTWVVLASQPTQEAELGLINPAASTILYPLGDATSSARLIVGDDDSLWVSNYDNGTLYRFNVTTTTVSATYPFFNGRDMLWDEDRVLWIADISGDQVRRVDMAGGGELAPVPVGDGPMRLMRGTDGAVWAACATQVCRIDPDTLTVITTNVSPMSMEQPRTGYQEPYGTCLAPSLDGSMWCLSRPNATITLVSAAGVIQSVQRTGLTPVDCVAGDDGTVYTTSAEQAGIQQFSPDGTQLKREFESGNTLPNVISALCGAAGISAAELDVSELPNEGVNMVLVSVQAAKAPLEILLQTYRLLVVGRGTQLVWRPRGAGDIVAELTEEFLDVGDEASEGNGLQIERLDDVQIPTQIDIVYVDPQQLFQQNTQRHQLAVATGSLEEPRVITIPLALPATRAKQLAEELLLQAWLQRETFQTSIGRPFAYLEPGDRVTVTARGFVYTCVIAQSAYGRPGIMELTLLQDDAVLRDRVGNTPGIVRPPNPISPTVALSMVEFFLLPALTSTDLAPRFHIVYKGTQTPWPGASFWRSVDDEATYQMIDSSTAEGTIGTVATATPSADYHFIDDATVITVVLTHGELTSIAESSLYAGGNLCAVGDELLCFGAAELVDDNTYELTHLLRGRRGTEWAVGSHGTNETFVLIDSNVRPISLAIAEQGITRQFKTVTSGGNIANVDGVPFAPTAENLNPWTVANGAATQVGDDWVLTWFMRSRFNGRDDFSPIGFDPDFLAFRVDIFDDNTYTTVVRSTTTDGGTPLDANAEKTWTYDDTMQTADLGSPQSQIWFRIYQLTNNGISHPENLLAAA